MAFIICAILESFSSVLGMHLSKTLKKFVRVISKPVIIVVLFQKHQYCLEFVAVGLQVNNAIGQKLNGNLCRNRCPADH